MVGLAVVVLAVVGFAGSYLLPGFDAGELKIRTPERGSIQESISMDMDRKYLAIPSFGSIGMCVPTS